MNHLMLKFNHGVEIGARLAYVGHFKRTYSWVYRNKSTDAFVLVMRPHRKSVDGKYRVLENHTKKRGWFEIADMLTVKTLTRKEFRARYEYVGGLNTNGRPSRKLGMSPSLGAGYEPSTVIFDDPYQSVAEQMGMDND